MSALKMVRCGWCDKQAFIPGDLPPLATEPCKNCGHQIMMPMQLRQFELRSKIASGGMATVFVGSLKGGSGLRHLVALKRPHQHLIDDPGFRDALLDQRDRQRESRRQFSTRGLEDAGRVPEARGGGGVQGQRSAA